MDSATTAPVPANQTAPVHRVRGWQRLVLWTLGLLMRVWGATLRFETTPGSLRQLTKTDEPVAMVLWHNRLFFGAEIFRRFRQGRPVYALVSASKDGAWLAAFFAMAGLKTVRGSSSHHGREAALLLVNVLKAGNDIGITPDGPRGPPLRLQVKAAVWSSPGGHRCRFCCWEGRSSPRGSCRVGIAFACRDPFPGCG